MTLFESITSVQPKEMPPEPEEYRIFQEWKKSNAYRKASFEDRNKKEYNFYGQDFIKEYLHLKWLAQLHNKDAIWWLVEYRDHHNPNETELNAINQKLIQFLKFIGDQKNIFPMGIDKIHIEKANWDEEE